VRPAIRGPCRTRRHCGRGDGLRMLSRRSDIGQELPDPRHSAQIRQGSFRPPGRLRSTFAHFSAIFEAFAYENSGNIRPLKAGLLPRSGDTRTSRLEVRSHLIVPGHLTSRRTLTCTKKILVKQRNDLHRICDLAHFTHMDDARIAYSCDRRVAVRPSRIDIRVRMESNDTVDAGDKTAWRN